MYTGMRRHITSMLCVEVCVDVGAFLFAAGARASSSYERSRDRPHSACKCCVCLKRGSGRGKERGDALQQQYHCLGEACHILNMNFLKNVACK